MMRYRFDSILLGLNRRPYESQSASLSFAAVRFMQVELLLYVRLIPQEMESAMRNAGIHANTHLEVHRMYNAVGIDVSKGKSTIAVLQPGGTVIRKPFDVSHPSLFQQINRTIH